MFRLPSAVRPTRLLHNTIRLSRGKKLRNGALREGEHKGVP
jgi:hypothetical protein